MAYDSLILSSLQVSVVSHFPYQERETYFHSEVLVIQARLHKDGGEKRGLFNPNFEFLNSFGRRLIIEDS